MRWVRGARREPRSSLARNHRLCEALFLARYIEKYGTGTLMMIRESTALGLPEPVFEQRGGEFASAPKGPQAPDRPEVWNPGTLPRSLTLEKLRRPRIGAGQSVAGRTALLAGLQKRFRPADRSLVSARSFVAPGGGLKSHTCTTPRCTFNIEQCGGCISCSDKGGKMKRYWDKVNDEWVYDVDWIRCSGDPNGGEDENLCLLCSNLDHERKGGQAL